MLNYREPLVSLFYQVSIAAQLVARLKRARGVAHKLLLALGKHRRVVMIAKPRVTLYCHALIGL
jgi:hypothetical protein